MSKTSIRIFTLLFAFVFAISLVGLDLLATAQEPATESQTNANMQNDNTVSKRRTKKLAKRKASAADQTNEADLSGTYSGVFDCSDAGLVGDTTLTITGNQFTTSDGKSGRITAATTRGYTAVAMQVGELMIPAAGQPAGSPPMIVSMRARRSGDRLILRSVPGAIHRCTFTPSGANVAKRRTRRHPVSTATGEPASAAQPAETMPAATETTPAATPRRRRGRRSRMNTNMNMNTNTNENENTGAGNQNMEASPTPTPPR